MEPDDYGIRCVIAADFGDIFYINSLKNGLLPVPLEAADCADCVPTACRPGRDAARGPAPANVTGTDGSAFGFKIDPFRNAACWKVLTTSA